MQLVRTSQIYSLSRVSLVTMQVKMARFDRRKLRMSAVRHPVEVKLHVCSVFILCYVTTAEAWSLPVSTELHKRAELNSFVNYD